jgi:plasmid stabilization system protein ParE
MQFKVLILEEAEQDIDQAYLWYELEQIGLGDAFYNNIQAAVKYISQNPLGSREIFGGLRRCIVHKFPYGIYYHIDIEISEIKIVGVIHFKRSSKVWKKRFKK